MSLCICVQKYVCSGGPGNEIIIIDDLQSTDILFLSFLDIYFGP